MSSTAEVKDAIRMAQQYNIHIYKYLINGLVDSSLTATKLRAELEVSCHIHIYTSNYKQVNMCINKLASLKKKQGEVSITIFK